MRSTDEEARARADGATFFQFCLRYYNSADRRRPDPGEVNMWDEYQAWKEANPEAAEQALSGGLIGSPETIRASCASSRRRTSTRSSC